jgi:hypothetical protein
MREAPAVAVPGRVDALVVDLVVGLQRLQHFIEELQVAVGLSASAALPPALFAFRVGELAGRR